MYAGHVACCPLVSHGEYADGTDKQMDGRQIVTLCFPLDAASITRNERTIEWITHALHDTTECLDKPLQHVVIDGLVNNLNTHKNSPDIGDRRPGVEIKSYSNNFQKIFPHD